MIKTSVATYSFGEENIEDPNRLFEIIKKVKEMGFDGIEFEQSDWRKNYDHELAKRVRDAVLAEGLEVVNYCVTADFLNGSNGNLEDEIKQVCEQIDFAVSLGSKKLRHDASIGFKDKCTGCSYDDALPRLAKGCLEVTKYAEQKGVVTCTENHGYFSQDSRRVEKLICAVNHPNFGACVDMGNFMVADEDPCVAVARLMPYAKHVHTKDFHFKPGTEKNPGEGWFMSRSGNYLRGAIVGHGVAKIDQSIGIVKRSGYDGFITIEFEGLEQYDKGVRLGLDNLKKFIADEA